MKSLNKFLKKGPTDDNYYRPFYQMAGCLTKHGKKDRAINVVSAIISEVRKERREKLKDYITKSKNIEDQKILTKERNKSLFLTRNTETSIITAVNVVSPFWNLQRKGMGKKGKKFIQIPVPISANHRNFLAIQWLREAVNMQKYNHKYTRAIKWCRELFKVIMGISKSYAIQKYKSYLYSAWYNRHNSRFIFRKNRKQFRLSYAKKKEIDKIIDKRKTFLSARQKGREPVLLPEYAIRRIKHKIFKERRNRRRYNNYANREQFKKKKIKYIKVS